MRAEALRDVLNGAGVTAIFTSPAARAKETAKPLAIKLGITPVVVPMDDARGVVDKLRDLPGRGNILIVGHSDTVPQLLKALGHSAAVSIGEAEFDDLFVLVPGEVTRPHVIRLRYKR